MKNSLYKGKDIASMTIAYLIDYNLYDNSGVIQKVKQQALQWNKEGHMVYFVSPKTMSIYDIDFNIIFQEKSLHFNLGRIGTAIKLLYNSYQAPKLFEQIEFDLIYMRYRLYMPFINNIFKKNSTIMEINSDDTTEYQLHSQLTSFYNNYTRHMTLKHINAFVSVSHELKNKFDYLNKPIEVIANGIDTTKYQEEKVKKNPTPILVFIGTPDQPWHGLEKVLKLAEHFPTYQFYIIGTTGDHTNNVRYFGYLSNEEATKIISQCDVGIGTLSLYKKGLTEASPLKTRQYLACGLPIIYAYNDTDIPSHTNFGLQLTNEDNNLNYQKIDNFIENVFNNFKIKQEAKTFAEEVLNYKKKERVRLDFFKKVLSAF